MLEIILGVFVSTLVIIGIIFLYIFLFPDALNKGASIKLIGLKQVDRTASILIFLISKSFLIATLLIIYVMRASFDLKLFSFAFLGADFILWTALILIILRNNRGK